MKGFRNLRLDGIGMCVEGRVGVVLELLRECKGEGDRGIVVGV